MAQESCEIWFQTYIPEHLSNVLGLLNPDVVCTKLALCPYKFVYDRKEVYENRVLKDTPPIRRPKVRPDSPKFKILVINDIHADLKYKEV